MNEKEIERQIQLHRKEIRFHRSEVQRYESILFERGIGKKADKKRKEIEERIRLIEKDKIVVYEIIEDYVAATINDIIPALNRDSSRDVMARQYDMDSFRSYLLPHLSKDSRFKITRNPIKRNQYIIQPNLEA